MLQPVFSPRSKEIHHLLSLTSRGQNKNTTPLQSPTYRCLYYHTVIRKITHVCRITAVFVLPDDGDPRGISEKSYLIHQTIRLDEYEQIELQQANATSMKRKQKKGYPASNDFFLTFYF